MLNRNHRKSSFLGIFLLLSLVPFSTGWADGGGGSGVDTDSCLINIAGERISFTAYTPQLTGPADYCGDIPGVSKTNLVFDLQGKNFTATKLKKMMVGFEVFKGSEDGEVVFALEPKKYPTGTLNTVVDFSSYGPGDYTVRITAGGDEVHMPLSIGGGGGSSSSMMYLLLFALGLIGAGYVLYLYNPGFKGKVDKLLKKEQQAA